MITRAFKRVARIGAVVLLLGLTTVGYAQELRIVSWNVESGGALPQRVAQRIGAFQGVDLWGLSEVAGDSDAGVFETGAEAGENANFSRIVGSTGGADRLVIIYNTNRLTEVRRVELHNINPGNRVRSPLVAHFRDRRTNQEFLFMVNHLYRGSAQGRHQQAQALNVWGRSQRLPVIAVGDYNFDWQVANGDNNHDRGFDLLTAGGVFTWVRPQRLIRNQCNPNFDSVLDFVFVNAAAGGWQASSQIIVQTGDCPDDNTTPDHRPVGAVFDLSPQPDERPQPAAANAQPRTLKQEILQRIAAMEEELRNLRELVRRLP